jgi:hypothetical protein
MKTLPCTKLAPRFEQGALDYLCGIYAAINALGLVAAPRIIMSDKMALSLMQTAIDYLHQKNHLCITFTDGMRFGLQLRLTRVLAKTMADMTGLRFHIEKPLFGQKACNRQHLIQAIEQGIMAGSAVMLCLENTYDHYTVVSGYSPSRFYLHDSDGLSWVARGSVGLAKPVYMHRHCINPKAVVHIMLI